MNSSIAVEKKYYNKLFVLFWLYTGVSQYMIEIAVKVLGTSIGNLFVSIGIIALVLYYIRGCYRYIQSHFTSNGLIILCLVFVLYLVNCIAFASNRERLINYLPQFITYYLPMYILGLCLYGDRQLYEYLKKASTIILLINGLYYFYYIFLGRSWTGDSMTFVSINLPSFMFLIGHFFSYKKNVVGSILSIVAFVFAMLLGSRGGMICILLFVALISFKYIRRRNAITLTTIFVLISILLFSGVFDSLIVLLARLTNRFSGSNRVIEFLYTGSFFEDANRDSINRIVWDYGILKHPLLGTGLFGDRNIIAQYYKYGSTYAHNFYLEVICQFGVILGGFFSFKITLDIFKLYRNSSNQYISCLVCLIITMGFLKLFMSGTYLTSDFFFIMVGVLSHNKRYSSYLQSNQNSLQEE